jgi:thymidylate synthase
MVTDDSLRGDGILPVINVEAETLAEAARNAILACWDYGARVETPKHQKDGSLGYDADMTIKVNNPLAEPKIYFPGIVEDSRGIMQYELEVTHGIHNHWKKDPNDPNDHRWGYTYNERIVDQLPFVFQRIKHDWDKNHRITGRDYNFTTWRAGEDIILEQDDPPCWQRGQMRFLTNSKKEIVLNYVTDWRSRDLLKAWNENNVGQIALMKLLAAKVSNVIGEEIKIGAYIDRSSSLHLYGLYVDRNHLEKQIGIMKANPFPAKTMSLEEYLTMDINNFDRTGLKRYVAAQSDAESKGHGCNQSIERLIELGYDVRNFPYPEEWDTWPRSWDAEPDVTKLARVLPLK